MEENEYKVALLKKDLVAMDWEFRYCQQRMTALQYYAQEMQKQISTMEEEIKVKKESEIVVEENK